MKMGSVLQFRIRYFFLEKTILLCPFLFTITLSVTSHNFAIHLNKLHPAGISASSLELLYGASLNVLNYLQIEDGFLTHLVNNR